MPGPEARRFCDRCSTHVHDLSSMTESEAQALLARRGGQHLCVRYSYRADGSIAFRPEPRAAPLLAVVSLAMVGCTGLADPELLEAPDQATVCRDASGYVVDCTLVDEADVPEREDALERVEGGVEGGVVGGVIGGVMGGVALPVGTPTDPPAEACPLPHERRDVADVSVDETPERSRVMSRRERRRARRAARRERRRARQGTLMGRLVE